VFSGQLFKVTPSFHDWRYIEVVRPLAETDFDFAVSFHESPFKAGTLSGPGTFSAGFKMTASMKPEIMFEILKVFQDHNRHDVYYRDNCQKICSGVLNHYDSFSADFRGCRNEAGYKAKYDRTLPLLRAKAAAGVDARRLLLVNKINEVIKDLIEKDNRHYEDHVYRVLIATDTWPDLLEDAGVAEKQRLLLEAHETVDRLSREIKDGLNQFALKSMEHSGWKVNGVPLAPVVAQRLKEAYQEGLAFDSGRRILIQK
jgi:hypothetical protein